jgi:type VI secretion system protein ImpE
LTTAKEFLKEGNLNAALEALQDEVRANPADAKKRIFLFQLLAVLGNWDRALNQLNVVADLDAGSLAMVQTYRELLRCEALREAVFEGSRSPLVFGDPERWIALALEALKLDANGKHDQAQAMRGEAYEVAEVSAGKIADDAFEWVADADSRIGPFLEAIVNGNYYWVPFSRIRSITLEPPEDLRDLVWAPAQFTWANGGETVGFIPSRYPGSSAAEDSRLALAQKTEWEQKAEDVYFGTGQRILATDAGEYSLLEVRSIQLQSGDEPGDAANES